MPPFNAHAYTTGQISKICKIAPRTVSKLIDTGKLKGFRIPCGKDRRVLGNDLRNFLLENGMGGLLPVELRSVIERVTFGYALAGDFAPVLSAVEGARIVNTEFDLALAIAELKSYPVTVCIGTTEGTANAIKVARSILDARPVDKSGPEATRVVLVYQSEDLDTLCRLAKSSEIRFASVLCDSAEQFRDMLPDYTSKGIS